MTTLQQNLCIWFKGFSTSSLLKIDIFITHSNPQAVGNQSEFPFIRGRFGWPGIKFLSWELRWSPIEHIRSYDISIPKRLLRYETSVYLDVTGGCYHVYRNGAWILLDFAYSPMYCIVLASYLSIHSLFKVTTAPIPYNSKS